MSKKKEKTNPQERADITKQAFFPLLFLLKTPVVVGNQIGRWCTIARMAFEGEKQVGFVTFVHGTLYEAMARLPPLRLKFLVLAETVDQPSSSMVSAVV